MKRCPKCQRTYSDETLNFCLNDGEWMNEVTGGDEAVTQYETSRGFTPS